MNPRRIILCVILPGVLICIGGKLYAQYRRIDIYVSRHAPMPAELATGLHVDEHKMDRIVQIESPYESAQEKVLSKAEIRSIRSLLAWGKTMPILVDSLTINSTNQAFTRRVTRRFMYECELIRDNAKWSIRSGTRSEIMRAPKQSD